MNRAMRARWLPRLLLLLATTACGEPLHDQHYQGRAPLQLHIAPLPGTEDVEAGFVITMSASNGGFGVGLGEGAPERFRRPRLVDVPRAEPQRSLLDHDNRPAAEVMYLYATSNPTVAGIFTPMFWVEPDHLLVLAPSPTNAVYVGGQRIPLDVPAGYHLVRRLCRPDDPFRLELVDPATTELSFVRGDPLASPPSLDGRGQYDLLLMRACGLTGPRLPDGPQPTKQPAQLMAFAPEGVALFLMHLPTSWPPPFSPRLDLWSATTKALDTIAYAGFTGGLKVADQARVFADQIEGEGTRTVELRLPSMAEGWQRQTLPLGGGALLSPDAARLAARDTTPPANQVVVHDLASGAQTRLGPGEPLVWSPAGDRLLVRDVVAPHRLAVLDLQGNRQDLPARDVDPRRAAEAEAIYLWPESKPLVLERRGRAPNAQWPTFAFSDAEARYVGFADTSLPGTHPLRRLAREIVLVDLEAGSQRTLLNGERGPIAHELAVSGDGRFAFAFTVACAGFSDRLCGADLHRIGLHDGQRSLLARLPRIGPLAASHDGRRVAISVKEGVFVLDVP